MGPIVKEKRWKKGGKRVPSAMNGLNRSDDVVGGVALHVVRAHDLRVLDPQPLILLPTLYNNIIENDKNYDN